MSEEGKNVEVEVTDNHIKTIKENNELAGILLELLKFAVEQLFTEGKLIIQKPSIIKVHKNDLNSEEILMLGNFIKESEEKNPKLVISVKRSGTGVTIIFDLNGNKEKTPLQVVE